MFVPRFGIYFVVKPSEALSHFTLQLSYPQALLTLPQPGLEITVILFYYPGCLTFARSALVNSEYAASLRDPLSRHSELVAAGAYALICTENKEACVPVNIQMA